MLNLVPTQRFADIPQAVDPNSGAPVYRPDIDGLRAIAILPVVLYHAGISGFQGGFVGVDVFFVISGYLMALRIMGGIDNGDFSLLRFYESRIRRIFPALFAMIAASTLMAWFFFMPVEFEYFARSVKAAALFVSNVQLNRESGYFDISAQLKPLLHTWSLAIEEQFYIVFPLLLVIINRIARKCVTPVLIAIFAASLGASIWGVYYRPVEAFYLSPYRVWELLLGALLALGVVPRPKQQFIGEILACAGILMIGFAVLSFNDDTSFPGLTALVPCVGAALIIQGRAARGPAGRLLTSAPLVFIGLVSYSLYLWHWPIIVFTRYLNGHELSAVQSGLLVAISFVVAVFSWHFIERPFRGHTSRIPRKPVFAAATATIAAFVVFGYYVISEVGLPGRLSPDAQKIYSAAYDESPYSGSKCLQDTSGRGPSLSDIEKGNLCRLGVARSGNVNFLVWGDSHSGSMAPAIDVAARQAGASGIFAGRASCPPLPDVELKTEKDTLRCVDYNAAVRDLIVRKRIPLVFMIAYWPKYVLRSELPNQGLYFDPKVRPPLDDRSAPIAAALDQTLAELKRQGTQVVLVMDVPEMGHFMPEALAKATTRGTSTDIAPSWTYTWERQAASRDMITEYAAKYGATTVDALQAICANGRCDSMRNGLPLYKDSDHITATTARSLSYLYTPVFKSLAGALGIAVD
ncbi:acyltransferase [Phyllobacterium endophyticum]|uniref:Acyltransferase n=2 Tax=Phyllobacterium endophyticum TaxID=1149773 RepID=A0A2P7B0D8_9HYPH|nr:acyltransferase [Phyllobacterium endophyticum]TYR42861.1 acyltransferase [Phyllobacterium endophyticum]